MQMPDLLLLLAGAVFLWAACYALNDISDDQFDRLCPMKRRRALAADEISRELLALMAILWTVTGLLLLGSIRPALVAFGVVVILNQAAYTFEPIRLKRRFLLDVFSGGFVSGSLRFLLGYLSLASGPIPLLPIAGVGALKSMMYLMYRRSGDDNPNRSATIGRAGKRLSLAVAFVLYLVSFLLVALFFMRYDLVDQFDALTVAYALIGFLFVAFAWSDDNLPARVTNFVYSLPMRTGQR